MCVVVIFFIILFSDSGQTVWEQSVENINFPIVNNTVHIVTQNCHVNITYTDKIVEQTYQGPVSTPWSNFSVFYFAMRGADPSRFDYFVGPVLHVYKPNNNGGGTLDCIVRDVILVF
jgi:hypothetical protein